MATTTEPYGDVAVPKQQTEIMRLTRDDGETSKVYDTAWWRHRRAAQPGAAVRAGQDVCVRVSTLASWHAPSPSFRRNQESYSVAAGPAVSTSQSIKMDPVGRCDDGRGDGR